MTEYYTCERCKGNGYVCMDKRGCSLRSEHTCPYCMHGHVCSDCYGKGKFDWIEKIVGINEKRIVRGY